ncbi:MAG: SCO family protein [Geobacteraceae bacterium]|nr:SCO family protein [Geobacteraceae bacterium]
MNIRVLASLSLCTLLLLAPVTGHAAPLKANAVTLKLHDLELLDQDGRRVRFRSDVIGDRLVAITFIYSTCTTVCPILDSIFVSLQDKLGERLGKDILLISISIDPLTDIPPRLKQHAKKLNAKPGWTFLTGTKANVDKVLTGLDMYAPDITNHSPAVIVGDGRTGTWRRFYGFPSTEKILSAFNELEKGRH